jgi:hypothetical protein
MKNLLTRIGAITALAGVIAVGAPQPAAASRASTALWAAAAAAIIGAIYYDSNHHPYWIGPYGRRHYVSWQVANYYRDHHWSRVAPRRRRWRDRRGHEHWGSRSCCSP